MQVQITWLVSLVVRITVQFTVTSSDGHRLEELDPKASRRHNEFWPVRRNTASVPQGRYGHATCALSQYSGVSSLSATADFSAIGIANKQTQVIGNALEVNATSSSRLLLFGGFGSDDRILGDSWIYDTVSNSWWRWPGAVILEKPPLSPTPRYGHSLVSVKMRPDESSETIDVGALLFGGYSTLGPLADIWFFSASSLTWSTENQTTPSPVARSYHSSVSIYVNTHVRASGASSRTTYAYLPILMFGGQQIVNNTLRPLDDLWQLSISSPLGNSSDGLHTEWLQWPKNQPWPEARGAHVAVAVPERQSMVVMGGMGENRLALSSLWELNCSTRHWQRLEPDIPVPSLLPGIADQSATYWSAAQCILTFGGLGLPLNQVLSAYCFGSGSKGQWVQFEAAASLFRPQQLEGTSMTGAGPHVYMFGGEDENGFKSNELWSLFVDKSDFEAVWSPVPSPKAAPSPRRCHSAVTVGKDTMIVYGGALTDTAWQTFAPASPDVWVLNTTSEMWTQHQDFSGNEGPGPRGSHSAVVDTVTKAMLVFGGIITNGYDEPVLMSNTVWYWSLLHRSWAKVERDSNDANPWPSPRRSHSAVMINSDMWVFGGINNTTVGALGDLWKYNTVSRDWLKVETINGPSARLGHTAVLINDRMFVFGGVDFGRVGENSVWRFEPSNHTWLSLPSALQSGPAPRYFHAAAALGTMMMITGGCKIRGLVDTPDDIAHLGCFVSDRYSFPESVWLFDTVEVKWERLVVSEAPPSRIMHTMVFQGRVAILYGGYGNSESRPADEQTFYVQVGCNAGQYTSRFPEYACKQCPSGTYSTHPGAIRCTQCPEKTTTQPNVTAKSTYNCSACLANTCHQHGTCQVSLPLGNITCSCDFGYSSSDNCNKPVYYYLIFFAISGAVLIVVLILLATRLCALHRKQQRRAKLLRTSRCELARLAEAWRINAAELKMQHRVDKESPGAYGEVWRAEYREMPVAVKCLSSTLKSPRNQREFEQEVRFMRALRHPNIVLFLGGGHFPNRGGAFLVMEYMARGTLMSILRDCTIHIDACQQLRFALDAARGMRFLHTRSPPCIHRDLKSSNLLVSERWVVKVADFGEACPISGVQSQPTQTQKKKKRQKSSVQSMFDNSIQDMMEASTDSTSGLTISVQLSRDPEKAALLRSSWDLSSGVGTLMWQSPEMLRKQPYGPSTDVYSFGVVLWEIYTREEPFHHSEFVRAADVRRAVLSGERPLIPSDCPSLYAELVRSCWQEEAASRPMFTDIVRELDTQLESWNPQ